MKLPPGAMVMDMPDPHSPTCLIDGKECDFQKKSPTGEASEYWPDGPYCRHAEAGYPTRETSCRQMDPEMIHEAHP